MKKLRLVFADDHPIVLAGMRDMFAQDIHFEIVACVSSPTALVESIATQSPDVVITDFSMPGDARHGDGLRLLTYLSNHFPDTRILVVTMMRNPLLIASIYKAGASGIVLKSDPSDTLKTALECLRLGRPFLHPSIAAAADPQRNAAATDLTATLSPKELEVLRRFTEGQSLTDIANGLNRSIKTISNQKRSAMRKLNAANDRELIAFSTSHPLFD